MPEPLTVYTISPSPDSTLAVEITESGLRKRKHFFVFERFEGELLYDAERPLASSLKLRVDNRSLSTDVARGALRAEQYPETLVESRCVKAKPLRGFAFELNVHLCDVDRQVRVNVGFGPVKKGRVHIEADAILHLTQLGLPLPTSFFGLIRTDDAATLHASLWGVSRGEETGIE